MITGKGTGFLIAAIALFFLGRMTQVGWLYLIDAVLWGMLALSAILPWLGVAFLDARRRVEQPGAVEGRNGPSEGDSLDIEVTLVNRAFWPRFFLSASYDCPLAAPGHQRPRFFLGKLPGSDQSLLSSSVVAYQRGLHHLGPIIVESSAPFGLFRRRVRLGQTQPVLVYPQIYPLQRLALVDGLAGEVMQRRKSRVGMEIAGSRPYFPGDPRRHIHWRNTARAGRPMVKEFEDPQDQTLYVLFDAIQEWGEGRDTTLEYGIKVAASVADYARRQRVSVRLWGGSLTGEVSGASRAASQETHAHSSWTQVLKKLAMVKAGEGPRLTESLGHVPPGSSALVVVPAGDAQSIRAVGLAAAKLHRVIVVALEDFGETEGSGRLLDSLEQARIPVVRCRPGHLLETFQSLEQLGLRAFEKLKIA
jgi:uncharacterized protein (DUF58 family)